jgi:flavin reductase (DIM6/NTAB) family NADH-FMN oxidoreductase RutF
MPESLKRRLRPLPQWQTVGLSAPQDLVEVDFYVDERRFTATGRNVIVALRPLTIGIALNEQSHSALESATIKVSLRFRDKASGHIVGKLRLIHATSKSVAGASLALFTVTGHSQRCLPWPYRPWNEWLQGRSNSKNTDPANFVISPQVLQQIMTFYICPRPVVLVSVDDGRHSNIFPMDLIGPITSGLFTLALRSTSQSVPTMIADRRVALSDVAFGDAAVAYSLGKHHRSIKVDVNALPFEIERSQQFALPVPSTAMRVRELRILHCESVGSHSLFVCETVSDTVKAEGHTLFHTSGLYHYFKLRQRQPLATA